MIRLLQFLVMAASGCTLIYLGQSTETFVNPYVLGGVSIGSAWLVTWLVCQLLDWRIRRRARALGREHEALDLFRGEGQ